MRGINALLIALALCAIALACYLIWTNALQADMHERTVDTPRAHADPR